eukprot:1846274-Pyramimonas_sp.AAC.1
MYHGIAHRMEGRCVILQAVQVTGSRHISLAASKSDYSNLVANTFGKGMLLGWGTLVEIAILGQICQGR